MPNYNVKNTTYTERLSVDILKQLGVNAVQNNLQNITAADLLTSTGVKIDVQYSQNFKQYGDFRLDFISAYNETFMQNFKSHQFFTWAENHFNIKINKVGKFFQENYLDAVIVLFYNYELIQDDKMPDFVLIVRKDELLKYLDNTFDTLKGNIKLNNKSYVGDTHGSAFIPIKAKDLHNGCKCFFGTINDLMLQAADIQKYLL
ncbi:hypothetical protein KDE12_05970 [Campylobacter sp. faydin G-105]|uniref:hypothetical protein n=1 Tax=Campylobacter anatolicus TaxID=2829105 RepID=UPI001B8FF887|nr:hypothetical protein [Campylobacter anatolicus]MBR8462399.1 hypothetical protein [Campylobacter anatolicus]